MLAKLLGSNGGQAPMPVSPPNLPAPARKRSMGEEYAKAIDEFHALQTSHDEAVARLTEAVNNVRVLEATLEAVKQDNVVLIRDRDWHLAKYVQIKTRLHDMAALLQHMLDTDPPEKPEHQDERVTQSLSNLEQEFAPATPAAVPTDGATRP